MPRDHTKYHYTQASIAKAAGVATTNVRQGIHRELLDPEDLQSVVEWIARYGSRKVRELLLRLAAGLADIDE